MALLTLLSSVGQHLHEALDPIPNHMIQDAETQRVFRRAQLDRSEAHQATAAAASVRALPRYAPADPFSRN